MKGIKKVVFPIVIGLAIMFGMQSASHASYIEVWLSTDSTFNPLTDIVVYDGGAGDANPLVGAVTYIGSVGGTDWTFNVTTGSTYPIGGSTANNPNLHLNSVDATSGGAGTIYVGVSAYGYTLAPGGATFTIGGVEQNSVIATAYSGANVPDFSLSNQIGSTLSFTGPGAFSGTTFGSVPGTPNPYSLSIVTEIIHTGAGTTSIDASVAVPEPFTLIFLGSCLLGAGMASRKFKF